MPDWVGDLNYRQMLEACPSSVVLVDAQAPDYPIVWVNAAFEATCGYTLDEVRGINCRFLHRSDRDQPGLQAIREGLREGKACTAVLRNYRKDGTLFWNELKITPLRDESGTVTHYMGVQNDVTARRTAEAAREAANRALKGAEAFRTALLESMPLQVFTKDRDGHFTFANQRFCDAHPDQAPVLGKTDFDLHPVELAQKYREDDQHVMTTGQPLELIEPHSHDGQMSYVRVVKAPLYGADGAVSGVVGMFWDVTEQQQTNAALRESESRYRSLFEQSNDAVFILDLDGNHLVANQRACDMLGYTPDEIVGLSYRDLVVPGEIPHAEQMRQRLMNRQPVPPYERSFRRKDGQIIPVEINVEVVFDALGRPVHIQSIAREISERKAAEEALKRSEARYRQVFQENRAVKLLIDPDSGQIIDANAAASTFYGYTIRELKSMRIQDINLLSDDDVQAEMAEAISQDRSYFEFRHRLASGEVRDVDVFSSPIDTPEGRYLYSIISDVTGKRGADARRQRLLDHLRFLNRTALELIKLPDENSVLDYIGQQLHLLLEDAIVIINRNLPQEKSMFIHAVHGVDDTLMGRILRLLGYSPVGFKYPHHARNDDFFQPGKLTEVPGGLRELTDGYVPTFVTRQLIRITGIDRIYLIGLEHDGQLYAGVQLYLRRHQVIEHPDLIEAFIQQATAALHRVQAVKSVQEKAAELEQFFTLTLDLLCISDQSGHFVRVNKAWESTLGYSVAEIEGRQLIELVHPEDREATRAVLASLNRQQAVTNFTNRYQHRDGTYRYIEWRSQPHGDVIYAAARDVTQRHEVEQASRAFLADMQALQATQLELSEASDLAVLYREMILQSHERLGLDRVALFLLDPAAGQLAGTFGTDPRGGLRDERAYSEPITPDHWTQEVDAAPSHVKLWRDDIIYDHGAAIGAGWKAASALWTGERAIGYLVCDNFTSGRPPRTYETELLSVLGSTFGHLIELKQTETTLRESEGRLKALFAAMPDLIFRNRADGTYLDYHAPDPRLLLVDPSDFLGKRIPDVLPEPLATQQMDIIGQALATGDVFMMEFDAPIAGDLRHFEVRFVPVGTDEVLAISRDVTEQRQAQQQGFEAALEKERMQLLTSFVQTAAHEFRTPLTIINSGAYLLAHSQDEARRARKLAQIDEQVKHINQLVNVMLKMVMLESTPPSFERIDLARLLHRLCQDTLQRASAPSLTCEVAEGIPPLLGSKTYLREALAALVDNACRFSPEDGEVTLEASVEGAEVVIAVQDEGPGIPPEVMPYIFQTFWRDDRAHTTPGLGLGLPLAQKILKVHGGSIQVTTEPGQGARFTVRLPIPPQSSF